MRKTKVLVHQILPGAKFKLGGGLYEVTEVEEVRDRYFCLSFFFLEDEWRASKFLILPGDRRFIIYD